jgi:hypothetical protein
MHGYGYHGHVETNAVATGSALLQSIVLESNETIVVPFY